ncbi:3-hydroxy-3-methylglutaryl-coenzyme A reductase-like isoform X2 [Artemia franciscana]|uniref:3-hydroxy-3-methylglutaryl coenzyme A reductase n=2 Tax=Artemia franciscana TaxID=6661 RepID=A0AA88HLH8_ARTSF|nr:hypothetical protein QYM36_009306 [Artemia franciscana]
MGIASTAFGHHGRLCASYPWEVIVAMLTITSTFLCGQSRYPFRSTSFHGSLDINKESQAVDAVIMTIVRSVAILYSYQRIKSLTRVECKLVLGIAALFSLFSSFVFTCYVINYVSGEISDLNDAAFIFLLLIDLSKVRLLAEWTVSSARKEEVIDRISHGFAIVGPALTLDTIVETLLIGIGTLTGVGKLEVLCTYACLSAIVNYFISVTFFPAILAIFYDLTQRSNEAEVVSEEKLQWQVMALKRMFSKQQPNPVVQRVKLIMAAGLMVVHAHCRWPASDKHQLPLKEENSTSNPFAPSEAAFEVESGPLKWVAVYAEQLVLLTLILALIVKFKFFEDRSEVEREMSFRAQVLLSPSDDSNVIGSPRLFSDIIYPRTRGFSISIGDGNSSDSESSIAETEEKETQTEKMEVVDEDSALKQPDEPRNILDCVDLLRTKGSKYLSDSEILSLVKSKHIPGYQLEKALDDMERGVKIRRAILSETLPLKTALDSLPFTQYDYSKVLGACCENVIGYVPIPVGVAGPMLLDGKTVSIPMATTEGCLVASTNRGCRALLAGGGVRSSVEKDGMSRGPAVRMPNIQKASSLLHWIRDRDNFELLKSCFDSTSRFGRLQEVTGRLAGRYVFLRFVAKTGDAMGMNMVSKGTEMALQKLQEIYPEMEIISLSGNVCTDKKPSAINWINGRGKSVVCEAVIPGHVVTNVLKTSVADLVDLNVSKNFIGSAMAGSIGGYNAHAANIVTAIYIATGQDPAQNVGSSNCMTIMEPYGPEGRDLYMTVTMPSMEVGTIGGGTVLPAQSACLEMLGVKGPHPTNPGENACQLARVICAAVMAGEISLMAALAAGHLVKSHLTHNRSVINMAPSGSLPACLDKANLTTAGIPR